MSGLVLKGNTISTTGEYLPAPYIDRIHIEDEGYTLYLSIFMPDGDETVDYESEEKADDVATLADLGELFYYALVFRGWDSTNNPLDKIVEGEVNIIKYWSDIEQTYDDDDLSYLGWCIEDQFEPDWESPVEYYDDSGQKFWKYSATVTLEDSAYWFAGPNFWADTDDLAVFVFATTIEWNSTEVMGQAVENYDDWEGSELLLQTQISDIAYENVFENNEIANRYQTEYMDSDDAIYDQVPLQALNSFYYKIDTMTHQDIVDYFQELIDQFNEEYEVANYPKLETMLNNLALVLEAYGEKAELVPQLNALRQVTPDKAPTAPIGKLYKRFRERIFATNKAIVEGEKLRRIVLFNGKIVDLRSPDIGTIAPSYEELEGKEVLYSDWLRAQSVLFDWTGGDDDWEASVVQGAFLFDYEKALRRGSTASKVLNVDKLEAAGIHIPYESFRISEAIVGRIPSTSTLSLDAMLDLTRGYLTISSYGVDADDGGIGDVRGLFDTNGTYLGTTAGPALPGEGVASGSFPYSDYSYAAAGGTSYVSAPHEWMFVSLKEEQSDSTSHALWDSTLSCTDLQPASYLVIRSFVNPVAPPSYGTPLAPIDIDYRLVCFELQDFFSAAAFADFNDNGGFSDYVAVVSITDTTGEVVSTLVTDISAHIVDLKEYYELCQQECAMNEDVSLFNKFFSEGILAQYEDDMENAPWIAAPVAFIYFNDLLTDYYGGDSDKMATAAAEIVNQINPVNGTLEAIAKFMDYFETLFGYFDDLIDEGYEDTITTWVNTLAIPALNTVGYASRQIAPNSTGHPYDFSADCSLECYDNDDCSDGYECASGKCVEIEVEKCKTNEDCPPEFKCCGENVNIGTGECIADAMSSGMDCYEEREEEEDEDEDEDEDSGGGGGKQEYRESGEFKKKNEP
tara:strand:+ start:4859 stop:7588 length:2730 start_codon:yes stop_codon:yes gene_type:complete